MTRALIFRGVDPYQTLPLARGTLYGRLLRQASMLAYADVFRLMSFACLCTFFLVLLLKPTAPRKDAIAVH